MIVKIIKMIDAHKKRINDSDERINFEVKHKAELMGLFHQEKKRAECLDDMSSEKNQDILEDIQMSDVENNDNNRKDDFNELDFDINNTEDNLDKNSDTQKEAENKVLDEIIPSNELFE